MSKIEQRKTTKTKETLANSNVDDMIVFLLILTCGLF